MAYRIVMDPQVRSQIRTVPAETLPLLADARVSLSGPRGTAAPNNEAAPNSWMRQLDFTDGRGFITYLVLDDQDRFAVLNVTWLG